MVTVRLPNSTQLLWVNKQNLERRLRQESLQSAIPSETVKADEHYNALASRQFQLPDEVASDSRYLAMIQRLSHLASMSYDTPMTSAALDAAKNTICTLVQHILQNYPSLDAPDIFATRNSRVSFEWQPYKTGANVIGSMLISVDGASADFQVETYDGEDVEVVFSEEEADLANTKAFLAKLTEALRSRREGVAP